MKKSVLIILFLACFLNQLEAQTHFGIKGGLNFKNFDYKKKGEITLDNSIGWQVGILWQYKTPIVGLNIQPEVLYTEKKTKPEKKAKAKDKSSIHYFEVPLNLQWGIDLASIRPYVMAGPYFGYAVNFSDNVFKSHINKFDWGVGLGCGIELWQLQFGARYSWGLRNISEMKDIEMKNNTFTLSLAFLF